MCANFQLKQTTLNHLAQTCPKRKLGFQIQKANVGIRISILEIPCVPIFRQNRQLWIFGPKFAQKWILGSEFQKSKSGFGIRIREILGAPIFSQKGQLLTFWPTFGEIAQLSTIFWFKYCWGCCRELCGGWNELGGAGWRLKWAGSRWMELYGAGWRWVHGLVIPNLMKVFFNHERSFWTCFENRVSRVFY